MGNSAGLNDASTYDVVMGVFYAITAIVLIVTAYIIYTKQFRRHKMEAVQTVNFVTAQYNIYKSKTQLLVEVPAPMQIDVSLLDKNEQLVATLLSKKLDKGAHIIQFNPTEFANGNYFLKLVSPSTKILKKIVISN